MFKKDFKSKAGKSLFSTGMVVTEKICLRDSMNGLRHGESFYHTLTKSIQYTKQANPIKYNEVVAKHVASPKSATRPTSRIEDKDFDNSSSAKRAKVAKPDRKFTKTFYPYFFGMENQSI